MAFTVTKEDEKLPQLPLVVVIYGDPGMGKTSFAFTSENPVLLDFDKGAQRAIGRKTTIGFDSWKDVEDFVEGGHLDDLSPKTIICDTAGTMLDDFIGGHVTKMNSQNKQKDGSISLKGYGAMKDVFNSFVMRDLRQRGIDLVIIAHVTESEDEGLKIKRPKLTGGSKDILIAKADLLGYMYMENSKRVIQFSPTDKSIGKNCAGFPLIQIKDQTIEEDSKNQLSEVIQKAKDHMEKETEAQKESLKKVEEFKGSLSQCETLDEVLFHNDTIDENSETYKVQMRQLIMNRYEELWAKLYLDSASEVEHYQHLIEISNEVPKRYQRSIKVKMVEKAKTQEIFFDKENKKFYKKEKEPTETKEEDYKGEIIDENVNP